MTRGTFFRGYRKRPVASNEFSEQLVARAYLPSKNEAFQILINS